MFNVCELNDTMEIGLIIFLEKPLIPGSRDGRKNWSKWIPDRFYRVDFTEPDILDLIFRPERVWIWIWILGIPYRNPTRNLKPIRTRNPKKKSKYLNMYICICIEYTNIFFLILNILIFFIIYIDKLWMCIFLGDNVFFCLIDELL